MRIAELEGWEILDSRGRPTVACRCVLGDGATGEASVPSGASTGAAEALELRDGDRGRYRGLGCRTAAANVGGEIAAALKNREFASQNDLDMSMLRLDGTANKSRLGANALLAVSLAFARAAATSRRLPLYRHLSEMAGVEPRRLPRPTINLFSGGKHAGAQVAVQDLLVVPTSATSIDDCLAMTYAVYQCAAELGLQRYGMRALTADEGGLAPPFLRTEAMFDDAMDAIQAAGLSPGRDVSLAIDLASSHFFRDARYHLDGRMLDSGQLIERVLDWLGSYPIVSVEDALSEDDWDHWPALRRAIGPRALVLGDDLLCTNVTRIRRAIRSDAASALLLKVNQVGTLSEACEAMRLARSAGWMVTVSARSGETEDDWLADLSVGWAGDQLKVGSITQSERLAKYNRLCRIERETGLRVTPWPMSRDD